MELERASGGTSLIDVLDRVLDKGIVIDAWLRTSLTGIPLLGEDERLVIASTHVCLRHSDAVDRRALSSSDTFGSYSSSESALKRDDDDDDGGGGGGGSSGAPALLFKPLMPRRRPESRPPRTRRS